jgi:hypothetical protein
MKKILVIHYSQSGQLTQILDAVTTKISSECSIEKVQITPVDDFKFPWKPSVFFSEMADTVALNGSPLKEFELKETNYDLIILGYQPWFLSPSRPIAGLFENEKFTNIIQNTPIVTVIGARNMWLNSQKDILSYANKFGAKIVGNIPLIDKNPNLISVLTISYWMFTGRKDKKWGIFPKPGVSDSDISDAVKYGPIIEQYLLVPNFPNLQDQLIEVGKFKINWDILFIEERAKKIFYVWTKIIKNKGTTVKKKRWLVVGFRCYLTFALFVISPIILSVYLLLFRVFLLKNEKNKVNNYLQIR